MLYAKTTPAEKRASLRAALASGELLRFPGAFNPLSAKLIQDKNFDGADVGARHDQQVGVASRVGGGPDALESGVLIHHLLAVEVTAPLGVDLVFDVQAGDPRILEGLHGAGDVHRLAEPGVRVHQGRQVGHARDLGGTPGDLGQGGEPDVGQA